MIKKLEAIVTDLFIRGKSFVSNSTQLLRQIQNFEAVVETDPEL